MDPKKKARVEAGLGGFVFGLSLLRGRTITEAQAEARVGMAAIGPLVEELAPHAERLWEEHQAKRAAKKAEAQAPRCGKHAGIACVLPAGHLCEANPWHQDEHGTLFQ